MLIAILFNNDDQLLAAAPACDQLSIGDRYWIDIHEAKLHPSNWQETAYIEIADSELLTQLFGLGVDEAINGRALTDRMFPKVFPGMDRKAA